MARNLLQRTHDSCEVFPIFLSRKRLLGKLGILFVASLVKPPNALILTTLNFIIEFQVMTDYFSHNTTTLHSSFSRTWKDLWKFEAVSWLQRMKIFLQFLLGEYSFYKKKMKEQAQRLI